jgi:regulator of protease activity HflC (stomatin/prohibitin superfamily)
MLFDMNSLKHNYESSKRSRILGKWIFSLATFGLGGLYLWVTTKIIQEGEVGLRQTATGKLIILPPGRHSNFPWESYPTENQSLSKKIIKLGPYHIITVETGYVAKTYNKGKLEILGVGQHLLGDASHTFEGFIPIKQETKKLHKIIASTSDNVGLTLHADVRYQIENPETAVTQIDDIEDSIKEIAEINISQIVSHHSLMDFGPATSTANFRNSTIPEARGIGEVVTELSRIITEQLAKLGIKLINIGITSWQVNDSNLAHELAQGAVVKSQTQSRLMAAENAFQVKKIETDAESNAIITRAAAEAKAIQAQGAAYIEVAQAMQHSPVAQAMYTQAQQIDMVSRAQNVNLFFHTAGNAQQPPVVATIPLSTNLIPAAGNA